MPDSEPPLAEIVQRYFTAAHQAATRRTQMTEEDQQAHQARADALAARIEALPPFAREMVSRWLPSLERLGRTGPTGSRHEAVRRFVEDVGAMLQAQWAAFAAVGPKADHTTGTSGFPNHQGG